MTKKQTTFLHMCYLVFTLIINHYFYVIFALMIIFVNELKDPREIENLANLTLNWFLLILSNNTKHGKEITLILYSIFWYLST